MARRRTAAALAARPGLTTVALLLVVTGLAGCAGTTATPSPAAPSGSPADDTPTSSAGTSSTGTAPTGNAPGTSPTGAGGCPRVGTGPGPASSQVVVVVSAPASAAAGSTLAVTTQLVVLSDGPRIVARPSASALELFRGVDLVAVVAGTGAEVPTPLTAGRTLPAQTVPDRLPLTGCDGAPLAAGAYRLRAVVGYGGDPLSSAQGGSSGGFAVVSDPVDLTVT